MSLEPAKFSKVGDTQAQAIAVMFNPASVKVTVSNKMPDDDAGGSAKSTTKQSPKPSITKMETELVFDTTQDGSDVRQLTRKITQHAISLKADGGGAVEAPSNVQLVWGVFFFRGIIESLTETLDFWSAEGIPLRSTLQLTLASLDGHGSYFSTVAKVKTAVLGTAPPNGALMTAIAAVAGDVNATRAIGAANGAESLRFGSGGPVAVGGGVQLQAAAGFSASAGFSAGAGIGLSAGAGIGGSAGAGFGIGAVGGAAAGFATGGGLGMSTGAGFSAGASAGFGASAGAGFGTSAGAGFTAGAGASFGATASAGFGASAGAGFNAGAGASAGWRTSTSWGSAASAGVAAGSGAFAGLGASKSVTLSSMIDPSRLLSQATVTSAGSGSSFDITGQLTASGSGGLSANVSGYAGAGVRIW